MIINDGGVIATRALTEAARLAQMNIPYRWGANGPDAFDCSGFVQWCMSVGGYPNLPKDRRVWVTGTLRVLGSPVAKGAQLPGDLIFPDVGHVGICVNKTQFIDAPETGKTVGLHDYTRYNNGNYSVVRIVYPSLGPDALAAAALIGPNGVLTPIAEPIIAAQKLYDAINRAVTWLSDPANWIRIGMLLAGGALVLFGIIYLEDHG